MSPNQSQQCDKDFGYSQKNTRLNKAVCMFYEMYCAGVFNWLVLIDKNLLSGEPDYFGRNKISSGGDLSHYSSASLY